MLRALALFHTKYSVGGLGWTLIKAAPRGRDKLAKESTCSKSMTEIGTPTPLGIAAKIKDSLFRVSECDAQCSDLQAY
jgi:hypothetical protein